MLVLFCFVTQPHLHQLCHLIQIVREPFGTVCKPECKTYTLMAIQRRMGPLFEKGETGGWGFIYSLTMQSDATIFIFDFSALLSFSRSVVSNCCDPMDCSPPSSSVRGVSQARILEWITTSSSRGSSWPKGQNWVSCIAGRLFTDWTTR